MSRVMGRSDDDIRLEAPGYDEVFQQLHLVDGTPEEAEVLQMIRNGEHVDFTWADGRMEEIRIKLWPDLDSWVQGLLKQHPFQNVKVNVKDWKVTSIAQEVIIKPRRGSGE